MGTKADGSALLGPSDLAIDYGPLDWPTELDRLLALVDTLPTKPLLIGYSMGARLGLTLALRAPERFAGLAMISGHPGLPPADRADRLVRDLALADQIESNSKRFLDTWYDQSVFAGLSPDLRQQLEADKRTREPAAIATQLRHFTIGRQPDHGSDLETLDLPLLVLAGERDAKYAAIARRIQATAPNATTFILPDVGHLLHLEDPKTTKRHLAEFEARLH